MTQAGSSTAGEQDASQKVSLPLAAGIAVLPGIFVWFLLRKGHSTIARAIGFGWTVSLLLVTPILTSAMGLLPEAPASPSENHAAADAGGNGKANNAHADLEATRHSSSEPKASPSAPPPKQVMSDEKRRGMHCLNSWDGSHWKMQNEIRRRLRNPDSFDHIETRIAPIDKAGNHSIFMTYRAQNGFGGMNVEQAFGVVDNAECELHTLQM